MLTYHLENALADLQDLIEMTEADMEDIKVAQHDPQFERLSLKDEKLKSFEAKKAMIDHTISTMVSSNPDVPLPDLLDARQHELLEELRNKLLKMKDVNQKYAKMVLVVSNLYNEFLEQLVPTEMQGYKKVASKDPSILEVRV